VSSHDPHDGGVHDPDLNIPGFDGEAVEVTPDDEELFENALQRIAERIAQLKSTGIVPDE